MKQLVKTTKQWNIYKNKEGVLRFENELWEVGHVRSRTLEIVGEWVGQTATIYRRIKNLIKGLTYVNPLW